MVKAAQAPPSASSLFCTAERMTCRQACRCDPSLIFSWCTTSTTVASGPCPAALRERPAFPALPAPPAWRARPPSGEEVAVGGPPPSRAHLLPAPASGAAA
eukprot:1141367-Pelagomonas_calceolata.AAC.1